MDQFILGAVCGVAFLCVSALAVAGTLMLISWIADQM